MTTIMQAVLSSGEGRALILAIDAEGKGQDAVAVLALADLMEEYMVRAEAVKGVRHYAPEPVRRSVQDSDGKWQWKDASHWHNGEEPAMSQPGGSILPSQVFARLPGGKLSGAVGWPDYKRGYETRSEAYLALCKAIIGYEPSKLPSSYHQATIKPAGA